MQMNKHRQHRLLYWALPALALLAAAFLPAVLAQTQNEPPAQTPTAPATTRAPELPPMVETDNSQQTADPNSTRSKPLTTFKPTEKIQADSAVAFPIDI